MTCTWRPYVEVGQVYGINSIKILSNTVLAIRKILVYINTKKKYIEIVS